MNRNSRWTLAIVSIALLMATLDNLVVTTALPSIRTALDASVESLDWTVNAYTLAFAVLLLGGAALGDRFGRRRMFVAGLLLFTASSAAAALSSSVEALIAARAVQGAGAAVLLPLTLTLLNEAVAADRRGLALGIWSGVAGLGVALGPLVGGARPRGSVVAVDLLDQRPDRARAGATGDAQADRVLRARPRARPPRSRAPPEPVCSRSRSGSSARRRSAGRRRSSSARCSPVS